MRIDRTCLSRSAGLRRARSVVERGPESLVGDGFRLGLAVGANRQRDEEGGDQCFVEWISCCRRFNSQELLLSL